jgi:hypothetical protein
MDDNVGTYESYGVMWTLHRGEHVRSLQVVREGALLELQMLFDGQTIVSSVFTDPVELKRCAYHVLGQLQADGWALTRSQGQEPAGPPHSAIPLQ